MWSPIAELVFGAIEAAVAGDQFGLAIALESGTRDHVEDAISAVAIFGGVAAALHLEVVDVLGIELRPNVGSNIRIGDGNAVNQPRDLMSAANVELIVDHVRAGHVVGDHAQTVGLVGARRLRNLLPADQRSGRRRLGVDGCGCFLDFNRLLGLGDSKGKVEAGVAA